MTKAGVFLLLFLSSLLLQAQDGEDPLSKKERLKFNEIFFMAQKQKMLGHRDQALELYQDLYKITAFNGTVCYELAQLYAEQGDESDAIFFARRAVELEPENRWFQLQLASVYRAFDQPEKEIAVMEKLVALEPANPDYRYELAMAQYRDEQYKKAIASLDELEAIIGINEILSDQKKQIYLEEGDLQGAVLEMEKLIEAFPKQVDYYGTLAQIYMVNGMPEEAYDVYQEMLKVAPDDPRPHLDLAQYYQQRGENQKSLFHLKKAIFNPELDIDKKVPILLSLFEASYQDSSLQKEAYSMLESVMEQNPEDPKAYAIYGDFLSRDGRNLEALRAYKKATQLEGGNRFQIWEQILLIEIQAQFYDSLKLDAPMAVELFPNQPLPYFFAGVAFTATDEPFEAIGYLEDGLNYVLGNPRLKEQFYTHLANAYHSLGEHDKSDQNFEKALALNAKNPTALNNYAYYLSVRGEKLDKALQMTESSNALEPGNAVFLDTWAWVLYQKGDYALALEKMERVIELGGGKSGEVLEHYGDILYKNGRPEEAVEQWKKAREMGDSSPMIEQKIKSGKIVE